MLTPIWFRKSIREFHPSSCARWMSFRSQDPASVSRWTVAAHSITRHPPLSHLLISWLACQDFENELYQYVHLTFHQKSCSGWRCQKDGHSDRRCEELPWLPQAPQRQQTPFGDPQRIQWQVHIFWQDLAVLCTPAFYWRKRVQNRSEETLWDLISDTT